MRGSWCEAQERASRNPGLRGHLGKKRSDPSEGGKRSWEPSHEPAPRFLLLLLVMLLLLPKRARARARARAGLRARGDAQFMPRPSGARACGPQRVESEAHERTLTRRLRLVPLRAESRLKARGPSELSADSCRVTRSKKNGRLPMNLPLGARACGPQRVESAAHERTIRRRLRLVPLRAESPRSVRAVRLFMSRDQVKKERAVAHEPAARSAGLWPAAGGIGSARTNHQASSPARAAAG